MARPGDESGNPCKSGDGPLGEPIGLRVPEAVRESPGVAKIWRIAAGCGRLELACSRVAYHAVASPHRCGIRTNGFNG